MGGDSGPCLTYTIPYPKACVKCKMEHGILYYFGIAFIAMAIVKGVQLIWHLLKGRNGNGRK